MSNSIISKYFTYFILLLTFLVATSCKKDDNLIPQSEFEGNVILQTQEQVDEFGAKNHTEITGNLIIGDSFEPQASITNLNALWICYIC